MPSPLPMNTLLGEEVAIYLPDPYPDELLYSVVARHLAWTGENRWRGSVMDAFASRKPFSADVPSDLSRLEQHAGAAFAFQIVVKRLTLFPYYTAYTDETRKRSILHALQVGDRKSVRTKLGLTGRTRSGAPRYFRYCQQCRDADLSAYGETYWRRAHHLKGVLFCVEHATPLVETSEEFARRSMNKFADATTSTSRMHAPRDVGSDRERALALAVSHRCRNFLEGDLGSWPNGNLSAAYRKVAVTKGF